MPKERVQSWQVYLVWQQHFQYECLLLHHVNQFVLVMSTPLADVEWLCKAHMNLCIEAMRNWLKKGHSFEAHFLLC